MKTRMRLVDGRVNLPTYAMIGNIENGIVQVDFPDDEATDGKPDIAKICKKYKGNPHWDRPDVEPDVDLGVVTE